MRGKGMISDFLVRRLGGVPKVSAATPPPALNVASSAPGMVVTAPFKKAVGMRKSKKGGMRRQRGKGLMDMIKKAHAFLKKHRVISRGATGLSQILPPKYRDVAGKVGSIAGTLGYGRRRGGALRLSGAGYMGKGLYLS